MAKQFIICKNDSVKYSLPVDTSQKFAQALLQNIKREQGEKDSNGKSDLWTL